jgi:hypothetical protein
MDMWARIKPHALGTHRVKRFSVDGILFSLEGGWLRVKPHMAEELEEKTDHLGRKIFEVMDRDAAIEADRAEDKEKRGAPVPDAPVKLGRTDAPDAGDLPIDDYDSLSAKRIVKAIERGDFDDVQIAELTQYEEANDGRRTVVKALDRAAKKLRG